MKVDKECLIGDAEFPSPFISGLEYTPPARGMWNIVHVGLLIPESHQIFICAGGCLRGVVLTAAEMGAEKRFSTVSIEEFETIDGSIEENLIEGVEDVINRLPEKPKAILVYTSCIHNFLNVDLERVYRILRTRYQTLSFTDCYMTPTMRKSGINPDEKMRMQLYSLIDSQAEDDGVTFVGDVYALDKGCDIVRMVRESGRPFREIPLTRTFSEYQSLGASRIVVYANPAAKKGAETFSKRLGKELIYLPYSFDVEVIRRSNETLSRLLGTPLPPEGEWLTELEAASKKAHGYTLAIDYTASARPLSLSLLLLRHGFEVTTLYLDAFNGEEAQDFETLRRDYPDVKVIKASCPDLPFNIPKMEQENILAIGQKAAYYLHTAHFVNLVADGGHYGFEAIVSLCHALCASIDEKQNTESIITVKGWGCNL